MVRVTIQWKTSDDGYYEPVGTLGQVSCTVVRMRENPTTTGLASRVLLYHSSPGRTWAFGVTGYGFKYPAPRQHQLICDLVYADLRCMCHVQLRYTVVLYYSVYESAHKKACWCFTYRIRRNGVKIN